MTKQSMMITWADISCIGELSQQAIHTHTQLLLKQKIRVFIAALVS